MKKLNTILLFIAAGIVLAIIAATAVAVCTKNAMPGTGLRKEDPRPARQNTESNSFSAIGQLRIRTKSDDDSEKAVLVLTPWLEYEETDSAFYEELDRKRLAIRAVFTDYFSSKTKPDILSRSESDIKRELQDEINKKLVLGHISRIYFNDYLFLD